MKRSQIILGGSAFILAIAGAFASKANRSTLNAYGITISGVCQKHLPTARLTLNTADPVAKTSLGTKTLYTVHRTALNTRTVCAKVWHINPNN